MRLPTDYNDTTSQFGPRGVGYHNGLDYAVPERTECFVIADNGKLVKKGEGRVYGKFIDIDHGTFQCRYAHLIRHPRASIGTVFNEGDTLGNITGNTGLSTGPHLHFETRIGEYADIQKKDPDIPSKFLTSVDPELFLEKDLPLNQMLYLTTYEHEDWESFIEDIDGVSRDGSIGPEELSLIIKMGYNLENLVTKLFKF